MGRPFRGDPHTLSCTGLSSMAIQPRPEALGHSHLSDFVLGYSHCELTKSDYCKNAFYCSFSLSSI